MEKQQKKISPQNSRSCAKQRAVHHLCSHLKFHLVKMCNSFSRFKMLKAKTSCDWSLTAQVVNGIAIPQIKSIREKDSV